jgi:hypothetical protein
MPLRQLDQHLIASAIAWREVVVKLDEHAIAAKDILVEGKAILGLGNQRKEMLAVA